MPPEGTSDRRVCLVALVSPPYADLTYLLPEWLAPGSLAVGMRVAVPLGNQLRAGVIMDSSASSAVDPERLKPVWWPLEKTPLLPPAHLDLVRQLSIRQLQPAGRILASLLPAPLRALGTAKMHLHESAGVSEMRISDLRLAPYGRLLELGKALEAGKMEYVEAADQAVLLCHLTADPPWPVRPGAARQQEILEYIWEKGPVSRAALLEKVGRSGAQALGTLVRHGLVRLVREEEAENATAAPAEACHLTDAQKDAARGLRHLLAQGTGSTALLHGVTGSGKTAVYMEMARACLAAGKSVILLAPEVALAARLRNEAHRFLDAPIHFFHGYQGPGTREKTFRKLARANEAASAPCVLVGTRSALFLPVPKVGLIVLDEEHDSSFKQDEGLTYQAKEVAYFRSSREGALLLLGSATPDVRVFHAARQGRLPLFSLPKRIGSGGLPALELVDIRGRGPEDGLLSPEALGALRETVERGEQAVILLNRRGYAPLMYCLECSETLKCPHCSIGLTYHKGRERLLCHYCGYSAPFPLPCPRCGSLNYLPMGEGTERLEETLESMLPPGAGILRLDRDTSRRSGALEEILAAFAAGKAQVLVGTQMLSKGHHFPDVTLSIVADADLGLNLPDYRATERTFQLLVQAAGRAGRGEKPGRVLVQTRDVGHFCWKFVRENDYEGFYAHEIALRERRGYPPFVKLGVARFSYPAGYDQGQSRIQELSRILKEKGKEENVRVLGPAPAPLGLLRGRKRFQCLLKGASWIGIRRTYAAMAAALPARGEVRASLDIDPVSLM